ncbi:MAG: hypothetical protein MJ107_02035 [Lachnospiraceae bacterium]|nr:hypothetical protein [Lachnospiraceae bacterium]
MKKRFAKILAIVMAVCVLAACGSSAKNLEDYYTKAGRIEQINTTMMKQITAAGYGSVYSNVWIEVKGDTLSYYYQFADDTMLDPDMMASELDKSVAGTIASIKGESGVSSEITVKFIYLNADGSELYTYTNQG